MVYRINRQVVEDNLKNFYWIGIDVTKIKITSETRNHIKYKYWHKDSDFVWKERVSRESFNHAVKAGALIELSPLELELE